MTDSSSQIAPKKIPWNKSRFTGAKPPFKAKQVPHPLQAGAPLQLRFCTKVSLNCIKLVT